MYAKVEERIAYGRTGKWNEQDFKRKWRVRRAKKELEERFGLFYIRRVAVYTLVLILALIALVVVEATGTTHVFTAIYSSIRSSIDAAIGAIAGLLAAVAAIVPSFKLAFVSNQESSMSRGDVIFKKASTFRDKLGFLESVKRDLQELFDFLREFEEDIKTKTTQVTVDKTTITTTKVKIVIVPIIDDLDRCIKDGRNVKVLEAMQLILSVPGAPILSFLAVDSRIVVASIEEHYEKVFAKTNISGFEYLDKIVQIPFALPEPPPDKVKQLMSKTLEGNAASPEQVAQRLRAFSTRGLKILKQNGSKQVMVFKVAPTRENPEGATVNLASLLMAIEDAQAGKYSGTTLELNSKLALEEFQGEDGTKKLELDSKLQALKLVCAAARQLGPYLKTLADRPGLMDENVATTHCMNKEEATEILCRETNAALEDGNLGFEEVPYGVAYAYMGICSPLLPETICAMVTLTHTPTVLTQCL